MKIRSSLGCMGRRTRRQVAITLLFLLTPPVAATDLSREEFLASCRTDVLARFPDAVNWRSDGCDARWQQAQETMPLLDAVLAVSAADDSAPSLGTIRDRLPQVQWQRSAPGQRLLASGDGLGMAISVTGTSVPEQVVFRWGGVNEDISHDLLAALAVRNAQVRAEACQDFGSGESTVIYTIRVADEAPRVVSVYTRIAPTAIASSWYTTTVYLDGRVPSLERLNADEGGWTHDCDAR